MLKVVSTVWNKNRLLAPLVSVSSLYDYLNNNNYIWTVNKTKKGLIVSVIFENSVIDLEVF